MLTTNRNLHRPFLLSPSDKDYLWGAESWKCSVHPEGLSYVAGGIFRGWTLQSVLEKYPSFLGSHPNKDMGLPILVKLIDAREKLSIQVHPDDEYAAKYEKGSLGKTEMWYVLDAETDAEITYGFVRNMDRKQLLDALEAAAVEQYLNRVKIEKDDVFYVKAGTVHGIGAGAVIAEIQENSNLTYRLYDYDRVDKNGQKRPLHIEKALEVVNYGEVKNPRQPMRILRYQKGCASEFLCRCEYFQVERLLLNTKAEDMEVVYSTDSTSFEVLLCVEGTGQLSEQDETGRKILSFRKGDCIFVPADSVPLLLAGNAQLLKIHC